MDKEIYNQLCRIAGSDNVLTDEPMDKHITFRVGGNADFYVIPHSIDEVKELVGMLKSRNYPYYILGNGSNMLIGDKGYRGAIIKLYKNMSDIQIEGNIVTAQAGALLSKLAACCCEESLEGLEFAAGIPGTLGGAVVMNAGAYGGEMKDVLLSVTVLDDNGEIIGLNNEQLELGYRSSIISKKGYIVLEAKLKLKNGNSEEIKNKIEQLRKKRIEKQPLEYASAGSTFKRPEGYFAGKLIMDSGLKGRCIGGAKVSEKHCGFIINTGNATAKDIKELIEFAAETVYEKFGVKIETEVKMLGDFS